MSKHLPSPPPETYRAEPMSLQELDTHPDKARIWATLVQFTQLQEDISQIEIDRLQHMADRCDCS